MSKFGWCMDRKHSECKVEYERFYFGPKKRGKKMEESMIYTGETRTCDCKCHKKGEK